MLFDAEPSGPAAVLVWNETGRDDLREARLDIVLTLMRCYRNGSCGLPKSTKIARAIETATKNVSYDIRTKKWQGRIKPLPKDMPNRPPESAVKYAKAELDCQNGAKASSSPQRLKAPKALRRAYKKAVVDIKKDPLNRRLLETLRRACVFGIEGACTEAASGWWVQTIGGPSRPREAERKPSAFGHKSQARPQAVTTSYEEGLFLAKSGCKAGEELSCLIEANLSKRVYESVSASVQTSLLPELKSVFKRNCDTFGQPENRACYNYAKVLIEISGGGLEGNKTDAQWADIIAGYHLLQGLCRKSDTKACEESLKIRTAYPG